MVASRLASLSIPLAALLVLAAPARAGTRYVDASASGANNGSSWADAYSGAGGLTAALAAAVSGDEIWVADGTYLPSTSGLRSASFTFKNGVTVYGGFAGGETSLSQRDLATNVAILSGDLAGDDASNVFTDNSLHVLNGAGGNSSTVYDGFTVRGGNADGSANDGRGGGILCVTGDNPTVRNCTFTANRCALGGGAGYINNSSPTFLSCTFDANFGASFGGALDMVTNVGATLDRCVFKNNSAVRAGAIEIYGSSPVKVSNSLFFANTCTGPEGGGAIYVRTSATQIRNCTIIGNTATASATGGILASGGTPIVTNCIVLQNTGTGGVDAAAQVMPMGMQVSHSLVPAAFTGTGNVSTPPTFDSCGPYPYRLAAGSVGIDAGSNAGVAAGFALDLGGSPRFVDVPSVANTGVGTGALVDMGCYESDVDCNANGIPDACDVLSGTSLDLDANGIPDECECPGGAPPTAYCTAKVNSQFCTPAVGFSGHASASNFGTFLITASSVLNQKSGLLFYGYAPQATPFLGGTLCVGSPIRRTPTQTSGGTVGGNDCTGTYSFDFNAYIATGADPLLSNVGQPVCAQWWSRDPLDPFTTGLTNAVQFGICQ
jgi:predicted outer membrane repeat protein